MLNYKVRFLSENTSQRKLLGKNLLHTSSSQNHINSNSFPVLVFAGEGDIDIRVKKWANVGMR